MRVIVAGSRDFEDYQVVRRCVSMNFPDATHIVSGTARGADQLGERYALEMKLILDKYPADWNKHGKSAGYRRNELMAQNADALIAFWDGVSSGTRHMIHIARKAGLIVVVIVYTHPYHE